MYEWKVARFLGWMSIGLGVAQIVAPRTFTRTFGTRDRAGLVRTMYGLREIATGVGILTATNPAPFLWARVAGDVIDLTTLGTAHTRDNPRRPAIGAATAAVAAVTALDLLSAGRLSNA